MACWAGAKVMGFKSVRDSLSATSPTWALSVCAFYVIQDHPAYIPRGQRSASGYVRTTDQGSTGSL